MKMSIKLKLFLSFFGLILVFVIFTWIMNSVFLEKYYISNKEKALMDSYYMIESLVKGVYKEGRSLDAVAGSLEFERMESFRGIGISIIDTKNNLLYSSRLGMPFQSRSQTMKGENLKILLEESVPSNIEVGKPKLLMRYDNRLNSYFMLLYSKADKNVAILLNTSVRAIQDSADIASRFSLFTGLFVLIAGAILIFLISSGYTKPIRELNDVANRISLLDFSKKYRVRSTDEIGQLSESIDSMSTQLERSISDLKTANKKLMEDIENERQIDNMRRQFISNVSHEFKTPLSLIAGYSEGLAINVNDDEESRNYYCEVIIDETRKLNSLVRQLLDLSSLEYGGAAIEKSVFDIKEMIESIIKKNSIFFNEKQVKVSFEVNTGTFMVYADELRMEQVLNNFISNALNHVDLNGSISIRVEIPDANSAICPDTYKYRIFIKNTGSFIPPASIPNLWTSFYKVDKSRSRSYGGTGLGLSIVKAVLDAHNNNCGVYNTPDGVEFWFDVDIADEA